MDKNRKRKKEKKYKFQGEQLLTRLAILGKSGASYNLNTFIKTEKNKDMQNA